MRKVLLTVSALLVAAGAGCTPWFTRADPAAMELAMAAQGDAARLPDSPEKQALVTRLERLNQVLAGDQAPVTSRIAAANQWYDLFGPERCVVDSFTKFADFDGDGNTDGLEVRVRLMDRFDDPVKALGSFRIETFAYQPRSLEKRGSQVGNWSVSVFSEKDVRKYYDGTDRSYRFPLRVTRGADADRVVVQVTYYVPDGSGTKLFADRVIKVGG